MIKLTQSAVTLALEAPPLFTNPENRHNPFHPLQHPDAEVRRRRPPGREAVERIIEEAIERVQGIQEE
jgi:hypothetical protein